jgi:putative nucleotidyltransferase with HDIG domain
MTGNKRFRRISIAQLSPGMVVHELDRTWLQHPFLRGRMRIQDTDDVARLRQAGIREVSIDLEKGCDIADIAPPPLDLLDSSIPSPTTFDPLDTSAAPLGDTCEMELEILRARGIREHAMQAVQQAMNDVRLGRAVELAGVEEVAWSIMQSVARNRAALASLLRVKKKDDYTFLHSVSVATLMVALARDLGENEEDVLQAGLGGLLHDIGKARIPDEVLNKPGRLTPEEFELVKRHPEDGYQILAALPGIGELPLVITRHHHERMDGKGYPAGQSRNDMHRFARMAAIVDVYDALTSERCYRQPDNPAVALRRMMTWSGAHFDSELFQAFVRCVGIYPVGSLLRLRSGRLAVVREANERHPLAPRVTVFFSTRSNLHLSPENLDLSSPGQDQILSLERPQDWGVDPERYL